jgi:hypothetical protein
MRIITILTFVFLYNFSFGQQQIIFQENFDSNPIGWRFSTASPHDWKWYPDQGLNPGGGLRMKLPSATNYFSTPLINFEAGVEYTVSFKSKNAQSSESRKISLYYNSNQTITNATNFYTTVLQADSYSQPPYKEYNPTFTVSNAGNYSIIFDYTELGYLFTYFDEIVIEKTLRPSNNITFPANNSVYNEGTDLNLTANASDEDGTIVKVEFFANNIKLTEDLIAPYEFLWKDILPNNYVITSKATDNRGNTKVSAPINMTMQMRDGTISKYVNWNFNTSVSNKFDFWTLKNADFRTRTGWHNSPCLEFFSTALGNFAASPAVALKSDVTYTLEFLGDCSGNKNPIFSVNTTPTLGGNLIGSFAMSSTDNFGILKTKTFTVAQSGIYHLIINNPAAESYIQLQFDNIRIIGDLDVSPVSKMSAPAKDIVIAENSNMKLQANVDFIENLPIQKVEYYANNQKVGESTSPPYDILWQNIPTGNYQILAKPIDINNVTGISLPINAEAKVNMFSASSYLGSVKNDDIRGGVFQKNGIAVLIANIGILPEQNSIKLNNATDSTMGCIIRLASDGKSILSVTRIAEKLTDIAVDSLDNVYVGGINGGTIGGFYKLNPLINTIIWQKNYPKLVHRLDVGKGGTNIVLTSAYTNFEENTIPSASIYINNNAGVELSSFGGESQYTPDVTIDEASQTAIILGFKNFNTQGSLTNTQLLPVYVPIIRAKNFDGTHKWKSYDWGSEITSLNWLNRSNNNMADVRTSRASVGKDGKLYVTFEVYGGNHVLRYDPFDIMDTVKIVGGDNFFNFSNTGTETKIFVGKYNIENGNYMLGQQFTARLGTTLNPGNSVFARNGNIVADENGRVYLTGKSAYGLPLNIDHQPGEYTGGAYLLILSPDLSVRETCIRLSNGEGRFVAVQNQNRWIYGGSTNNPTYLTNPVQNIKNTGIDGFWSLIDNEPCAKNHYLGKNYSATPNTYKATDKIVSSHKLNTNGNIKYSSQKSILLETGFEVNPGTVFKASIGGCND